MGKQKVISQNKMGMQFFSNISASENADFFMAVKDKPAQMGDYWITFKDTKTEGANNFHEVYYERKDKADDKASETFTLYPNTMRPKNMGLVSNPDTRHYLTKDVFTYVSMVSEPKQNEVESELKEVSMQLKDTMVMSTYMLVLKEINPNPDGGLEYIRQNGDIAASAVLQIIDAQKNVLTEMEPIYYIRDNMEQSVKAHNEELGLTIDFKKIIPDKGEIKTRCN